VFLAWTRSGFAELVPLDLQDDLKPSVQGHDEVGLITVGFVEVHIGNGETDETIVADEALHQIAGIQGSGRLLLPLPLEVDRVQVATFDRHHRPHGQVLDILGAEMWPVRIQDGQQIKTALG
jgi:hypothetical protein